MTAEKARSITESKILEKENYRNICSEIEKSANKGEDHTYWYGYVNEAVITRLTNDGYKVERKVERQEDYYEISW